jgi:hypothetical protein
MARSAHTLSFEDDYLDIDHWSHRWGVNAGDVRTGQRLLDVFKPFLFALLEQRLSRKTLLQHRDNVCALGEHIVHRARQQSQLRRRVIQPVLLAFLDDDGGPLIYSPASSPAQRAFDSTCIKLRRFLLDSSRPS